MPYPIVSRPFLVRDRYCCCTSQHQQPPGTETAVLLLVVSLGLVVGGVLLLAASSVAFILWAGATTAQTGEHGTSSTPGS